MLKTAFESTVGVYRHVVGDIVIAVFAILGGLLARYYDILGLASVLDPTLAYAIYALACLCLSFPATLVVMIALAATKARARKRPRLHLAGLRLAEGMILDSTWHETREHSLTIINETGQDLKQCYIMLDELEWKNFTGDWEVVARDVFSEPFKWNRPDSVDGKIGLDSADRASFALILHHEYSVYNTTRMQSEALTDFRFVFDGGQYPSIGYGSDIRLRISIRAKDEAGKAIPPVRYLLYVHLLQQHGIPKVEVVRTERL